MAFEIEKGVPLPQTPKRGRPRIYPFRDMAVGDSVFVEGNEVIIQRARDSAYRIGSLNAMSFYTEVNDNGVRIWRVA